MGDTGVTKRRVWIPEPEDVPVAEPVPETAPEAVPEAVPA